MNEEMLGRIDERLKAFSEKYHQDREETIERYKLDREKQDQWRQGIEAKLDPIVRDHQIVVRGGKWVVSLVAGGYGMVKGWIFIKDHLK